VTGVDRDSATWQEAGSLYEARFGDFFSLIKTFSDFQMFKLSPRSGWLVIGFGQAYELSGDKLDILTHRGNRRRAGSP
jgi:putative heme iron utilization protein